MIQFDLVRCFAEWNLKTFNGALPIPELKFNSRLKTSAGRFSPRRRGKSVIEIATYLLHLPDAENLIRDTMGHEMIHYWLWENKRPYGHTPEFTKKMNEIGVSRYNSVPQHRPFKHCYSCTQCGQEIWVRKKIPKAACAACCNQHAGGRYHPQFKLKLENPPPLKLETPVAKFK